MMIEMITSLVAVMVKNVGGMRMTLMSTYHKKHPFAGFPKTPCCVEGAGLGNCSIDAVSYPEDHTLDVDYNKSEVVVMLVKGRCLNSYLNNIPENFLFQQIVSLPKIFANFTHFITDIESTNLHVRMLKDLSLI